MNISFSGKRILISGATKGIGQGISKLVHKLGATVIAVCHNRTHLDELLRELPGTELVHTDLSKWEQSKAALAKLGDVDMLVNNVGICTLTPFMKVTEEDFDFHASLNHKSTVFVSQIAAKSMIERGRGGSIVNISSAGGLFPGADGSIYCSLKAATVSLTKSMALELAKHKIRVNCVAPGFVNTDLIKALTDEKAFHENVLNHLPIPRLIETEEIAKAVCFLLSDQASVITGVTLPVDAGYLLNPPKY